MQEVAAAARRRKGEKDRARSAAPRGETTLDRLLAQQLPRSSASGGARDRVAAGNLLGDVTEEDSDPDSVLGMDTSVRPGAPSLSLSPPPLSLSLHPDSVLGMGTSVRPGSLSPSFPLPLSLSVSLSLSLSLPLPLSPLLSTRLSL